MCMIEQEEGGGRMCYQVSLFAGRSHKQIGDWGRGALVTSQAGRCMTLCVRVCVEGLGHYLYIHGCLCAAMNGFL